MLLPILYKNGIVGLFGHHLENRILGFLFRFRIGKATITNMYNKLVLNKYE